MHLSLLLSVSAATFTSAVVMRRDGCQTIPSTAPPDNSFNNGAPELTAEPPDPEGEVPACYGARDIDIPFSRLYHGYGKYFSAGQLNTPDQAVDKWYPAGQDSANQSACGIPDNAFSISKVAIHPYFLKYADLSRYCEQDVCISFWKEDGKSDMILKVTDICSTDPSDPTHCETPADIKLSRNKMGIMQHLTDKDWSEYPQLTGSQFPEKIWWFFTKCWADASPQPAYKGNNWFSTPELPSNKNWSLDTVMQQYQNNQKSYPAKGWATYPVGAYNTQRDDTTSPPISDWAPGDPTPAWSPIAGGKGWGQPNGSGSSAGTASSPSASDSTSGGDQSSPQSSSSPVSSAAPEPSSSTDTQPVEAAPEASSPTSTQPVQAAPDASSSAVAQPVQAAPKAAAPVEPATGGEEQDDCDMDED